MYGLAQSPRLFEDHMHRMLTEIGLKKLAPGLYESDGCHLFIYVDDLLITGPRAINVLEDLELKVNVGKVVDFNVSDSVTFLGAKVTREPNKTIVTLREYAEEHAKPGVRGALTRESMECNPDLPADFARLQEVQKLLGILGWLARFYPKASVYHSILASRATLHPCKKIEAAIQRVINFYASPGHDRILIGSPDLKLFVMSDASHSLTKLEARAGAVIAVTGVNQDLDAAVPVVTKTRRVKRKVKSAFEAELEAALLATELYKRNLPCLRLLPVRSRVMITDSQSLSASIASKKTQDPFSVSRLELLLQRLEELDINVEWKPRQHQLADELTKI